MTREEMIEQLENAVLLIKQNGKDWLDERDIPILEESIKSMKTNSCKDCISREEVADEFASWFGYNYQNQFFYKQIKDMKPVQPEQNTDKWIPVVTKLPEKAEKPYWVCLDDGYQCECRWTNDMYGIGTNEWSEWGWHIMDKPQYSRVVAWKPLPEPYKESEGE